MGFFRGIARICLKKRQVARFLAYLCNRLILHDFPLNWTSDAFYDIVKKMEDAKENKTVMNQPAPQQQTVTIPQAIEIAAQHHNAGRLQDAEVIYGQILKIDPNNLNALSLLGFLCLQTGRNEGAVELLNKAIAIKLNSGDKNVPQDWYAWLGIALVNLNRFDESAACYEKKDPDPYIQNRFFDQLRSIFDHNGRISLLSKIEIRKYKEFQSRPEIKFLNQLGICFISEIFTFNIGLMSFLDIFLKMGKLGWHSHQNPILLLSGHPSMQCYVEYWQKHYCPNECYLNYWREYFPAIISDPAVKQRLLPLSSRIEISTYISSPDGRILDFFTDAATEIQRQWNAEGREPLLTLSDSDCGRGQDCLKKMGVPADTWFVALHVREGNEGGAGTRNADISTYRLAIQSIVERGGWVIRMGGPFMTPLASMDHVIDYAHADFKSDWMDVFLWAKCRFFLGVNSGPTCIPYTFGTPSIMTNATPLYDRTWCNDLWVPKLLWSDRMSRYLTFSEAFSSPVGYALMPQTISSEGCKLIDNSPEEINDVVLEMMARLDGTQTYTEEDERLQEQFNNLEPNIYGKPQKIPGLARIGQAFIHKYQHFFV